MDHLSLFELNRLIRDTLDRNLEAAYWVVAEIGEMREARNGHCYLDLVEKSDDKVIARIRGNIWAYTYRGLAARFSSVTGQDLKPGISVLCQVVVTYHELYGLSLNIKDIDPKYTLGERARRRQEIIDQLIKDGVYDMNRGLELPVVPQRIAVISSPSAAGYGDFLDQLTGNPYGYRFRTRLFNALMQGNEAGESIINCLMHIHEHMDHFDVVVIIRGGGAQIDLDCFDDYDLASHVAQFPLPVITGIGHDRDETILDLIAHTRMKTPTAVAEFLVGGLRSFEENLLVRAETMSRTLTNRLGMERQRIQTTAYRLGNLITQQLTGASRGLDRQVQQIGTWARKRMARENEMLAVAGRSLTLLDPEKILQRGYTITRVAGKAIGTHLPEPGERMETITIQGRIRSTVTETEKS